MMFTQRQVRIRAAPNWISAVQDLCQTLLHPFAFWSQLFSQQRGFRSVMRSLRPLKSHRAVILKQAFDVWRGFLVWTVYMYAINLRGDFLFSEAFCATQPLTPIAWKRILLSLYKRQANPFSFLTNKPYANLYQAFLTKHIEHFLVRDNVFRPGLGVV